MLDRTRDTLFALPQMLFLDFQVCWHHEVRGDLRSKSNDAVRISTSETGHGLTREMSWRSEWVILRQAPLPRRRRARERSLEREGKEEKKTTGSRTKGRSRGERMWTGDDGCHRGRTLRELRGRRRGGAGELSSSLSAPPTSTCNNRSSTIFVFAWIMMIMITPSRPPPYHLHYQDSILETWNKLPCLQRWPSLAVADHVYNWSNDHSAQYVFCKVYFSAQLNKLRPILNLKKYYPIQHIFVPACSSARKIHFFKF